jgi:hypothetical protein
MVGYSISLTLVVPLPTLRDEGQVVWSFQYFWFPKILKVAGLLQRYVEPYHARSCQ